MAIDSNGNIHATSLDLKLIKIYTPTGELIREYGSEQLNCPSGLAVDDNGYCLVGDWSGKSLYIFDPQGKLIHSINFSGYVCGVTLDKDGFVYVVEYSDKDSSQVHVY